MSRVEGGASPGVWGMEEWARLERPTRDRVLRASSEEGAWGTLVREARRVMRAYTTSFFIVSRFLPAAKRAEVEAVYAAVRYPDEVVDTFPLADSERRNLLDGWQAGYEAGLASPSLAAGLCTFIHNRLHNFSILFIPTQYLCRTR